MPKLKGFHMVLQACHSEAIAFLLWALFGGGLESVVLATFFRFGNIFEQSILFSYMAAYGATPLPTNSLKQLFCLWLGPWSQLCDNFCTTPKPKKCHSFPFKATHQLIAKKDASGGCRKILKALTPGGVY